MMEVVKAIKALMDGCEVVRRREPLTVPKRELLSEEFLKRHPIYIVALDEEGVADELQPHAIGFYLSDHLIRELEDKPLIVVVFAEGFNPEGMVPEMSALLVTDDEVMEFKVEKNFEVSAVFALLKEHTEIAGGGTV